MATPLGTNQLNSLSRRYIMPQVVDNLYASNPTFFRCNARNKKILQGGTHIEVPLVYTGFAAGGAYSGFDLLDVSPSDTVKNAAFDWKQYYVPITVDGLTLIRANSPDAVVNFLTFYFENAQSEMAEKLGSALYNDGSATKALDGLKGAVDDGTVLATYGGLLRSSNTWWRSQYDSSTTALTLTAMQTMFGNCTSGGRHPTIITTTQANYNRYIVLNHSQQRTVTQPSGEDAQLAQAGFTNALFNGVPILVDSHVTANHLFFLNEEYINLFVNSAVNFKMNDFREPTNQDAMTSLLLWAGNVVITNCARQGKMTAVTS